MPPRVQRAPAIVPNLPPRTIEDRRGKVVPMCERCLRYAHDTDEPPCDGNMTTGNKRKCWRCKKHNHGCETIEHPDLKLQATRLLELRSQHEEWELPAGDAQYLQERLQSVGADVARTLKIKEANSGKHVGGLATPRKGGAGGSAGESSRPNLLLAQGDTATANAMFELQYESLRLQGAAASALEAAAAAFAYDGGTWVESLPGGWEDIVEDEEEEGDGAPEGEDEGLDAPADPWGYRAR